MPGYNPQAIEKKWQDRWAAAKTFATGTDASKPKYYVLDMFPYPSGQGLHVGHPEGYTATDIVARYKRAKGFNVMHPMGWDAFGLPAEQYAIKNNVHPRETTANNINRFRKQLQALGFSYDWSREVDTTDPEYYKWTQWIFLKLYDTWFDEGQQKGRAISELVEEFKRKNAEFRVQNSELKKWSEMTGVEQRKVLEGYRLAYEAEVPVNWCQGLGTVLANEEVMDGKSEVGGFPVERRPMKQWMLRITSYSERLLAGLEKLEWSDSLKEMQRNWIGKSEGAEVAFEIAKQEASSRKQEAEKEMLTVFTTRPDTLFGATYMVVAPEHSVVERITTAEQWEKVAVYRKWAAGRSDRERQEDTKKTGEFTGAYAVNPVTHQPIPIYISDYVLIGYGTGAIMAVPGHDQRDIEFARAFDLPIISVVDRPFEMPIEMRRYSRTHLDSPDDHAIVHLQFGNPLNDLEKLRSHVQNFKQDAGSLQINPVGDGTHWLVLRRPLGDKFINSLPTPYFVVSMEEVFDGDGIAINSPWIDGLSTMEAKAKMIGMLEEKGLGKKRVQYKIRDWLFSRQRYWGEPFPLVHLADGTTVRLADDQLPVALPELADFRPTGTIDPPLSKAADWVNVHVVLEKQEAGRGGQEVARVVPAGTPGEVKARRELNTMPQWAGSCWYYIRYVDARNSAAFVDAATEKYWLGNGVDLYVGGVEHAVLHLLYSRFWHKVLFDRGLVSCEEPFRRLVNQGLILGEMEYSVVEETATGKRLSVVGLAPDIERALDEDDGRYRMVKLEDTDVEKKGEGFVLKADPAIRVDARSYKMSKSRGNVVNPDDVIAQYGADALRMFEMFMGPLEQVKPWSTAGVEGVYRFLQRVWRNMINPDETDPIKCIKLLERHPEGKMDTWWTSQGDLPREKHAQAEADYQAILPLLHRTIKKVGDDIERLGFNTAIAAMMEFNNALGKVEFVTLEVAEAFLRILEPFAPHFADEVLSIIRPDLAGQGIVSNTQRPWPAVNPALLVDATMEIPVQVNGKLRGRIIVARDADEAAILAAALADGDIVKFFAGKEPKKKIYVKGRMVNIVV